MVGHPEQYNSLLCCLFHDAYLFAITPLLPSECLMRGELDSRVMPNACRVDAVLHYACLVNSPAYAVCLINVSDLEP